MLDLQGRSFGHLLVQERDTSKGWEERPSWRCLCDCGAVVTVYFRQLINSSVKSCGCRKRKTYPRHRMSKSSEYSIWRNMVSRCYRRNDSAYINYGGRGITVCDRWKNSFPAFLEDMGLRPGPEYSIDRINNNCAYEKGNCRWATLEEQRSNTRRNHRLTYQDQTLTIAEWSRKTGIKYGTLLSRVERGLSPTDALENYVDNSLIILPGCPKL